MVEREREGFGAKAYVGELQEEATLFLFQARDLSLAIVDMPSVVICAKPYLIDYVGLFFWL
jgi:hypothetical protein